MKPATNPAERRAFGRRESQIEAVVTIGSRYTQLCIVRNFSEQGALVEFASDVPAVATFRLRVVAKDAEALCEVRYRNGNQVGVRFVGGNLAAVLAREHAQHMGTSDAATAPERSLRAALPVKATTGGDIRRLLLGNAQQQQQK